MKKMILMAVMLINMAAMAQEPVITFEKTTHDFGRFDEGERVSTVFEFKNEGTAPLVLTDVKAGSSYVTVKWSPEPIEPGQVGQIKVTYNTVGRAGRFQQIVTVTSNTTEAVTRLYIKGEVIPFSSL
jgi:hypothetical protein